MDNALQGEIVTTSRQKALDNLRFITRWAQVRRLREDIARLEKYMPHRCPDTQHRAQRTVAELTTELNRLEAE